MAYSIKTVIMVTITLVIIGIVLPLGLGYIAGMEFASVYVNGTRYALTELLDSSVLTLLTTVLPIVVVVGILIAFLYFAQK